MKKNKFAVPQLQSQYAIIFIVLRFLRSIVMQLWPLLLAFLLGSRNSSFEMFEIAFAGLGIFGMAYSILSYYKYFFHLTQSDLVISQGILKKVKQNIPFERIQSINFRQTFVHQIFNVTEVEIETAGSEKQETKIDALAIPLAEELRLRILESKSSIESHDSTVDNKSAVDEQPVSILRLNQKDLIKVGLVQNHFKPVGLFLGLIGSLIGYSYSFDYSGDFFVNMIYKSFQDLKEKFDYFQQDIPVVPILLLIVLVIVLSVLYSVITTLLFHHNLHFWRKGTKFQVVRGLLTKKEFAALDNKIQILNWGQNPFERLVGFYNLKFKQARSGGPSSKEGTFGIPGCQLEQIDFVRDAWLGVRSGIFTNVQKISIHFFIRQARNFSFIMVLVCGILIKLSLFLYLYPVLIFWLVMILLYWISYTKKKYALNDDEVYVGGGVIGFTHAILPFYKVQNVSIHQNPYQWRRKLATLVIHTAGGKVSIPYIPHSEAENLLNFLIYKLEKARKPWM